MTTNQDRAWIAYCDKHDLFSSEWLDKGADEYFYAGYAAALQSIQPAIQAEPLPEREGAGASIQAEPVGYVLDCEDLLMSIIREKGYYKRQGEVPLYRTPPAMQPVHDALTIDLLNDKVMRQQAALVKCVEALHNSLPVGTDPIAICERHDAAIAKAERLIK